MQIIKGNNRNTNDPSSIDEDQYVSRLDKSIIRADAASDNTTDQIEMTIEVFLSFGDKLIDILCHDSVGAHDVCKMLALACTDALLDLDTMSTFIQFIAQRGYLANMIDSLSKIDQQLCRILDAKPETLKALYVYESKMAMLSRVASSHVGAKLLLENNTLSVLATMKVYDMHPDFQIISFSSNDTSFVPSIETRYEQILFPALNLCDVLLTTLSTENHSTITQVIYFLLSHGDMVEVVLRAGTPYLNLGLLQELSAITNLIARVTNPELSNLIDPQVNQDLGAHLYRLQKLMLTLFPRFVITPKLLKELNQHTNKIYHSNEKNKAAHTKYVLEVSANLALYVRNSISNYIVDHRTVKVLFSPTIPEGE